MRLKQVEVDRGNIFSVFQIISMTGCIPTSELIVIERNLNCHDGSNVDAYNRVHVRQGFGESIAVSERPLRFCGEIKFTVTQGLASSCRRINWPPIGNL